jgi:N-dimethylarginine dimethylaminohydrolase
MTAVLPAATPTRLATVRRYLMCPPRYFDVHYAINPWMDPTEPVDVHRARAQWSTLCETYRQLGHRVEVITPEPGLPDMVFAANGGLVVDGRAIGARFAHAERQAEGPAYLRRLQALGLTCIREAEHVNEGEGDFLPIAGYILAGTGFRTEPAAHREAEQFFGKPVLSLHLVDPRYYHLDTALAVLDDTTIAYLPDAFAPASRDLLRQLFPDAVLASAADAAVLGLNAVSDGYNVVLSGQADGLIAQLRERGYNPIGVDMSELRRAGGSVKCCTLEIRS